MSKEEIPFDDICPYPAQVNTLRYLAADPLLPRYLKDKVEQLIASNPTKYEIGLARNSCLREIRKRKGLKHKWAFQ